MELTHLDEARLDELYRIQDESSLIKVVEEMLNEKSSYIAGRSFGLSDLVAFSYLKEVPTKKLTWKTRNIIENCKKVISNPDSNGNGQNNSVEDENKNNQIFTQEQLFDVFKKNSIPYVNVEHPEVFTVEAMMPYLSEVKGAISKNLFLKDKKGKLFLLSVLHDRTVNLSDLAKKLKLSGLRFASEDLLFETLGVRQGHVTAYALINDKEGKVEFLIDKEMLSHEYVNFHPLVNTATTRISVKDFQKFVDATGHKITVVDF